jgi:hypothetical protein
VLLGWTLRGLSVRHVSGLTGRDVWKNQLQHDEASHGADAFLTFACSGYTPPASYVPRKRILRGIV